jgi:hypothetical protein
VWLTLYLVLLLPLLLLLLWLGDDTWICLWLRFCQTLSLQDSTKPLL